MEDIDAHVVAAAVLDSEHRRMRTRESPVALAWPPALGPNDPAALWHPNCSAGEEWKRSALSCTLGNSVIGGRVDGAGGSVDGEVVAAAVVASSIDADANGDQHRQCIAPPRPPDDGGGGRCGGKVVIVDSHH